MAGNRLHPRPWIRTGLMALALLTLVGCSPAVVSPPADTPMTQSPSATTRPATLAIPTQEPSATVLAPATLSQEPIPTTRRGLHATDPGGVMLASGRPQLVEFFAFW
jgi:hypothetical protein